MGTSLITNHSAMAALQTLRQVSNGMDTTQKRVSSGLEIAEASDNSAYWSISTMMRSDSGALGAVSKAMELGKSQIDIAYGAVEKSKSYLDEIQKSLTTGYEKGVSDIQKIQHDVRLKMEGISSAIHSANMAEKNIIAGGGEAVAIAGAYRREGTAVYVDMIEVGGPRLNFAKPGTNPGQLDLSSGVLKDVFGTTATFKTNLDDVVAKSEALKTAKADATKTASDIKDAEDAYNTAVGKMKTDGVTIKDFAEADLTKVDAVSLQALLQVVQNKTTNATSNVVEAAAQLGGAKDQVSGQIDYVSKLIDSIEKGVGALVDADMNAESARLSSLQVQQQLGIQALSIANQNGQNILSLFR